MSLIGRLGPFLTRLSLRVYATWNPADKDASITLSGGNLVLTTTTTIAQCRATLSKSAGKWYWELLLGTGSGIVGPKLGIANAGASRSNWTGAETTSWGYFPNNGGLYNNATLGGTVATSTAGDVIGFALDAGAGTLILYKNGVSLGTVFSTLTGALYPASGTAGGTATYTANFGATPFAYAVPSGFNPGLY